MTRFLGETDCAALVVAAGLLIGGCQDKSRQDQPQEPPAQKSEYSPFREERMRLAPRHPPATLLASGKPPLVLFFDSGGRLRLVDTVTREVVIRTTAPRGALISVHAEAGVSIGGDTVVAGPLPPGRRYEIWMDPPEK